MAKVVIVSAELVKIILISVGCLVLGAKISEEPGTTIFLAIINSSFIF